MSLITAARRWAGFPLDQLCASCGHPFYCAAGLPVCYGCRRNHARQRLLVVLALRALSLLSDDQLRRLLLECSIAEETEPRLGARG